jgi:translation initiation factor 1 (eIF-1/SUI1)
MTRVQRQKRKYVTVIAGLETVPDLKIKDATKLFGKKFSSGASVNEAQGGGKEVVIQGDVLSDLPALLMSEFKVQSCMFHTHPHSSALTITLISQVSPSTIFILEDGALRQYQ